MSITVNSVTKLYGQQKALDEVSFEIKSGEVVGFLGPNGAGKSTMMKIISCFIPQTSGDVSVCGHDVVENINLAHGVRPPSSDGIRRMRPNAPALPRPLARNRNWPRAGQRHVRHRNICGSSRSAYRRF